jgi:hypothetical protein
MVAAISIFNGVAIGVIIAVVAGIIYGATLYTSAGGKSDQAKKAISIICSAIIALLLNLAMFATLNFLVQGRLLNLIIDKASHSLTTNFQVLHLVFYYLIKKIFALPVTKLI